MINSHSSLPANRTEDMSSKAKTLHYFLIGFAKRPFDTIRVRADIFCVIDLRIQQ
jgi:hypothetical protein